MCCLNFHNEKVMAPLKPIEKIDEVNHRKNFHNEKVMAPLKQKQGIRSPIG